MKKLTLSLDEETIAFAHKLAKQNNDSISNMVNGFFQSMRPNRKEYQPRHPEVRELYGYTKDRPIPDKKVLREILLQKHLK